MATVSESPQTHYNFFKTTLKQSMTSASQTTGIKLNRIFDANGDVRTLSTTPMFFRFYDEAGNEELISAGGWTQSGGDFTLSDVVRDVDPDDGDSYAGAGNPRKWPAGTQVEACIPAQILNKMCFLDVVNTFTGSGQITSDSTTTAVVKFNTVTTAQRTAMSAANGWVVYDSDEGQLYQYVGGSWTAVGDTGTADATTTSAGKAEQATVAEVGAGTTTGGSGAPLFVNPGSVVKTSSGAGDENKLAALGSSGTFAVGFLGSGTPTSGNYLLGDGSWGTISTEFGDGSDGALSVPSGTTTIDCGGSNVVIKQYTSIDIAGTVDFSNPASEGTVVVFLVQGDVDITGTLDLKGIGSTGGSGGSAAVAGTTGSSADAGDDGTTPIHTFSQTREGGGGAAQNDGGDNAEAAGGGGAASSINDGNAASNAGSSSGGTAGSSLDLATIKRIIGFSKGLTMSPGAGGGGGGAATEVDTATGTGHTATGGTGGTGGGSILIRCGGNYSDVGGTIDVSGGNGGNGDASVTNPASNYSLAAGGGGGGSAGEFKAEVRGDIDSSGTHTANGGSGGTADTISNIHTANATNGANGAGGHFQFVHTY